MQIEMILHDIDQGQFALPEFQRGYVWNRDQVRALMDSLYQRHPVGSLLVWNTQSKSAEFRGEGSLAAGVVKLLLDGQQRITSLYGIVRGRPPEFFQGDAKAFTDLYFHVGREEFAFYQPLKMKDDPLWVDVTDLMKNGLESFFERFSSGDQNFTTYLSRLNTVSNIKTVDFHIAEVSGPDKTIDVVVDIFNRVNSGGTKLSSGDLALAKICADWPQARDEMRGHLERWRDKGYSFTLDWLLRTVNTVLTGEARFNALHQLEPDEVQDGLRRATKACDSILNLVASRLGLDHERVFFGRYAMPVMAHWLDRHGGKFPDQVTADRMLFWYVHSALWGRFSGSTETMINRDLESLESGDHEIDALLRELLLWHGDLGIRPDHFGGWSLGARFYPLLYLMTRMSGAVDWGTGLKVEQSLLGRSNRLEVHHIFPKSRLYKAEGQDYSRPQVNAVANFALLTQLGNLDISTALPEEYLPEIAEKFPGALESQWVPMDPALWRIDRYLDFLEARKVLLARAANQLLEELLHGEPLPEVPTGEAPVSVAVEAPETTPVPGGVESEEEEAALMALSDWVAAQGLPEGQFLYEIQDKESGEPTAILDLAWPDGLQEGLSQPVTVLLDEGKDTLAAANSAGYRYFQSSEEFRRYVADEIRPGLASG